MRSLTLENSIDILKGCAILGTGGGGDLENGIQKVRDYFRSGKSLSLISLEEIPDNEIIASPYNVGSVSPKAEESRTGLHARTGAEALNAFEKLQSYIGKKFYGSISIELGGWNTAAAICVAMDLGINLVDADSAGRSVPGVQHTSFYIENIPISPLAIATGLEEFFIIDGIKDDLRAEEFTRFVAANSGNLIGVASHPLTGKVLKGAALSGTITLAEKIGRTIRTALESQKDPIFELLSAVHGYFLFEGRVAKGAKWKDIGGYIVGEFSIEGENRFTGHDYRIWFKNENIISWMDGRQDVSAPDLITVLERSTGASVMNPYFREGMQVAVVGFKSHQEWRKEKGLKVFSPRSFGFNFPFIPIERTHNEFSRKEY
jgi:DUF917 family protein